MITLLRTNSDNQDFRSLTLLLDESLNDNYGKDQSEYDKYNVIQSLDTVVIAMHNEEPVGCGCFKQYDNDTVEIKRMFVKTDKRGFGIASRILQELENWAAERGFSRSILETGIKQIEAISLYKKHSYYTIPNYDQYKGMDSSVCFAKDLYEL
ncbi:MAG: GNAT family N-acetyltransferase [Ignavibacteriales bacterium]|nr:MAG: GNAT family N-acetyltransferase [Ignavibacteriales bacterium]